MTDDEMTDEEKLANGWKWMYSCQTDERQLFNPNSMPMIMQILDKIGDHSVIGGSYNYIASVDPASDTPDVKITKVFGDKVIYNFNDPKILEMLGEQYNATGNQESI